MIKIYCLSSILNRLGNYNIIYCLSSSVLNRLGKYDMIYCLSSLLYRLGQNILLERSGENR